MAIRNSIAVMMVLILQSLFIGGASDSTESAAPSVQDVTPKDIQVGDAPDLFGQAPRAFTENRGQLEGAVRYYDQGGSVAFTDDGVWFYLYNEDAVDYQWDPMGSETTMNPSTIQRNGAALKQEFVDCNDICPVVLSGL